MAVGGPRQKLSMISTVTNQGKAKWMIVEGGFNHEKLIEFLEALVADGQREGKKIFLILDNLSVHLCKPVKESVAEHKAQIGVFYLPSYSPELNHDERLNADLKHAIGTKVPVRTKARLQAAAGQHMAFIEAHPERVPSSTVYAHRFGSLVRAYQLVGFTPDRDYRFLEINRALRRMHPEVVGETERRIADLGGQVTRDPATEVLHVNREFTDSIVLARCKVVDSGTRRWKVRFDTNLQPDIAVAVRLDEENRKAMDYYLLPRLDLGAPRLNLFDHNSIELESFRFETLDYLYSMAERSRVRWAA